MELVAGLSGADLLRKHPDGLPTSMLLAVGEALAAALNVIHSHRVVHKDIKPNNFMYAGRRSCECAIHSSHSLTPRTLAALQLR